MKKNYFKVRKEKKDTKKLKVKYDSARVFLE